MESSMRHVVHLAVMSALFAAAESSAAGLTYYFSDCQQGAQLECIPGDNRNAGTNPSAPKKDFDGLVLSAGDVYRFARGGSWTNFGAQIYLPSSRREQPTTFTDYTPGWGRLAGRPILTAARDGVVFRFEDAGNSDADEGYIVSNLELRGVANTGKGVYVYNDADYVTVENVVIDGFGIGVLVEGSNPPNSGSDGQSSHFKLLRSVVRNNSVHGFLGAGPYLLIEGNSFDNNGFRKSIFDHNIYISNKGENIVVRGNTLTRNARVAGGPCSSVSLVSHGHHPNMIIENNIVYEDRVAPTCYGIDLNASTGGMTPQNFSNLIVRGNRVIFSDAEGTSGQAIGCSSCPGALIENNVVVMLGKSGTAPNGIVVPSVSPNLARGDLLEGSVTIRNNSIYIDNPSSGSTGIRLGQSTTTNDVVVSNMIVFGPKAPSSSKCFNYYGRTAAMFAFADNNLCYGVRGVVRWNDLHATLDSAQASGFDGASLNTDPQLQDIPGEVNGWNLMTHSNSVVINRGHSSSSSPFDIAGRLRDTRPDIGAVEWTNTSRPRPPGNLKAK